MDQQNNDQQGGYNPPPYSGYNPPPQGGYTPPPQQGGYTPPPPQGYPPPQGGYPPPQGYPPQEQLSQPGKGMAIAALVLGIISIFDPTIIAGIVLGIIGIILAIVSKNKGFSGGLRTGGLVVSIVGLVINVVILVFAGMIGGALLFGGLDYYMW